MAIEERSSTHIYHQKRMFTKEELAELEQRCVHEQPAYCSAACPLKLDARAMITALAEGDFSAALGVYEKAAPLPHILAALCEAPCRAKCALGRLGEGIDISALEAAAAHYGRKPQGGVLRMKKKKTAAVFGDGLFAAFAAGELARKAYPLTVYCAHDGAYGFLRAAAPLADSAGIEQDAAALNAAGVVFRQISELDSGFFAAEREKFDLVCLSPELFSAFGAGALDESVMLCRENNIISAPPGGGAVDAAFAAKKAALTADRLAQGLSPDNSRGEEGPVETRLYTNMEGVTGSCAVRREGALYTPEQAVAEAGRCIRCHCDECIRACAYLRHYKKYPKKLTREIYNNVSIIMGDHMMNKPINACALCGQCAVTCPNGYDVGEICHAARQNMVCTDKMPLAPHEFALNDMLFSNGEAFLCRAQPGFERCEYVLFPGCQADAIAPATVYAAYRDLSVRLGGGVGVLLGCCGAIADWAGRDAMYGDVKKQLAESLAALGSPTVIACCPTCEKTLRSQGISVTGIWDVLEAIGLPEGGRALDRPAAMHDSCGARGNAQTQRAVRDIARRLGCTIVETEYSGDRSPCCGYGGLVQYANPEVAGELARSCLDGSDTPYISYCMACRDRLAREGRESRHILELVYGESAAAAPDISEKRSNRLALKRRMLEEIWKEAGEPMQRDFDVTYTPEAAEMMDGRMILRSDVERTLAYMRETGEAVLDSATGLLITRHRDGNVTFWVKYEETAGGYLVHSAYSHRMNVVTR
ncbi:MAG: 4Fe-4S dicluster domain-containing protein [Oscillospiraceae bacterium]|nr:4Fe-4S dicluster domain-containing protein [Oscillospiraceae bacterium]